LNPFGILNGNMLKKLHKAKSQKALTKKAVAICFK